MSYLQQIPPALQRWVAPSYLTVAAPGLARPDGLAALAQEIARRGLAFPLVVKPDIGSQGYGVRPGRGPAQPGAYLEGFPPGAAFILPDAIVRLGGAGGLYVGAPGEPLWPPFTPPLRPVPPGGA